MREISLRAPLYLTEAPEKVRKAILEIFPDAELEEREGYISGHAHSLERFSEILRDTRIRNTARARILHGKQGEMTNFCINKQVAFIGKINFVDENELLGAIEVRFRDDDLEGEIDMIAPPRRRGEAALP